MSRWDVTAIGESMVRLDVPPGDRLERAARLDVHVGGAESNVLGALAGLGRRCGWVSRLPTSPLGERVLWSLRGAGVDVSEVVRVPGARQATYFVESGVAPRPTEVVYDREGSAAAGLEQESVPWSYLLDTRVLHLTGVSPAVGGGMKTAVEAALERARAAGVPVSFDVNFRSKLWGASEARDWLDCHARGTEVMICGRNDARLVFGLTGSDEAVLSGLVERLGARTTVLTLGDGGAVGNVDGRRVRVAAVPAAVLDRLGAGDAFAAGLLDGWLDGEVEAGMARGAALASLALGLRGDLVATNRAELDRMLQASAEMSDVRR